MTTSQGRRRLAGLIGAGAVTPLALVRPAQAQAFPTKPVRIVVPYAPGTIELEARALVPGLEHALGQKVLVETREGGGSSIGANFVAKLSPPDGYTLLYTNSVVLTVAPALRKLPFTFEDFRAVAQGSATPQLLAIGRHLPFHDLPGLLAHAKRNPGKLSFASAGAGSATHLATEVFADRAGIRLNHIPFNGLAPAVTAVLGGNADIVVGFPIGILPHAKAGKLSVIAHFDSERSPLVPEIAPLKEQGVDAAVEVHVGAFAARAVPDAAVARLSDAFRKAVESEEFQTFCRQRTLAPRFRDPSALARSVETEKAIYGDVIARMHRK